MSFKANEYGFFKEDDAGKNYTYYYSFDDGINSAKTEIMKGPTIRKGPKLSVDKLGFFSASENYYWWERYGFNLRAKNLNPEEYEVSFTLSTRTGDKEWTTVDTKKVRIGPDSVEVHFNDTNPFKVIDAGQKFYYRVKYSEYDQGGEDTMEQTGVRINDKIVPYKIYDGMMILNLVPMLVLIILGSFFIERKLKKGVESHESASGKSGRKKVKIQGKSGKSVVDTILKMLRGLGMNIDISTVMIILFPAGTLLLALLLILAIVLHINNLNRVHKLMAVLQHKKNDSRNGFKGGSKALLYKEMTVSQGINFTALALASWIMLFVAVAYLYLLVPTILPYSYMDIAELASHHLGFASRSMPQACS